MHVMKAHGVVVTYYYMEGSKVKLTVKGVTKSQRGSRCIALLFL